MEKFNELITKGTVKTGDREFTRLVGGFGEDKPTISDLQIAELLGYKMGARGVRHRINENIEHFEEGLHYIDLSKRVTEHNTLKETLISLGYAKQSITQASNIYILSRAGFLLYLKFAEGNNAVDLYKDFIDHYFELEAMNESMKLGIEEQIKKLEERKETYLGKSIMAKNEKDRMEYLMEVEDCNNQILSLEKSKSEKDVVEKLQPKIHIGNLMEQAKGCYDIGTFAKILNVNKMGRNNMFKWLRENKVLKANNEPYQSHMKYFKVIPTFDAVGHPRNKTLLKPEGVNYVVKRLIKDGKVVTKTVDEILSELPVTE